MYKPKPLYYHIILGPIVIAIFLWGYNDTLDWFFTRAMGTDSYYSHAVLIPFVTAFLIWQKQPSLKQMQPAYSWLGLAVILFALLLHLAGTTLYIFSISGFSVFFLIFGISLFIFGKTITRTILFPLGYLIFMIPLPLAVISAISFPMKLLVARAGVFIVQLLGISIFREGFHVMIPAGSLVIGNPCSGLRSLISFLAMGALLAYLAKLTIGKKCFLFLLAIPIALISNVLRVVMLIVIAQIYGIDAAAPSSPWHGGSGLFVFFLGLVMLFLIGKLMETTDE